MPAFLSLKWHPEISDPTFAGWLCTAAYIGASGLCVWAAMGKSASVNDTNHPRRCWLGFATMLLVLGINKQLDLQTLVIEVGRKLSYSEGWYGQRRRVQALFAALFGLAIAIGVIVFFRKNREFVRNHPTALAGATLLGIFLLLRASTVNHVVAAHIGDENWGWLLELAGNLCIGLAAFNEIKTTK